MHPPPPVGGIIKVSATKPPIASVPAYRTLPPIHEASIAIDMYKRAMDASITITQHELLLLSPEVRGQLREDTTTRWMPTAMVPPTQASLQVTVGDDHEAYDIMPAFALNHTDECFLPKGATIEEYYNSLEPGELPSIDKLTVAKESTAIRLIHVLMNTSQKVECTVDLAVR